MARYFIYPKPRPECQSTADGAGVKNGIVMQNDDHSRLQVQCNRFEYTEYAIKSDSTILQDLGSAVSGAGNKFLSNSSYSNNKLYHQHGNNPKYYYNPAEPVTSGMNITLLQSQADVACYAADSANYQSRLAPATTVKNLFNDKNSLAISAVPNPNNGKAFIYYSLGGEKRGELFIRDIQGHLIEKMSITSLKESVEINYVSLASGIYFLSLVNEKQQIVHAKMVITR